MVDENINISYAISRFKNRLFFEIKPYFAVSDDILKKAINTCFKEHVHTFSQEFTHSMENSFRMHDPNFMKHLQRQFFTGLAEQIITSGHYSYESLIKVYEDNWEKNRYSVAMIVNKEDE